MKEFTFPCGSSSARALLLPNVHVAVVVRVLPLVVSDPNDVTARRGCTGIRAQPDQPRRPSGRVQHDSGGLSTGRRVYARMASR